MVNLGYLCLYYQISTDVYFAWSYYVKQSIKHMSQRAGVFYNGLLDLTYLELHMICDTLIPRRVTICIFIWFVGISKWSSLPSAIKKKWLGTSLVNGIRLIKPKTFGT